MTRYLRMVRQGRWYRPRWLADTASEWQGDALSDLVTGKNALSVYQADSDEMIDLAVATLASNRDSLCNLDYTLIDDVLISRMDIHLRQVDSTTPHTAGNKLHWDIEHLTAANIFTLMQSITADTVTRVKWKRVREMLQCAIKDGHIDPCNLSSGIKKKTVAVVEDAQTSSAPATTASAAY